MTETITYRHTPDMGEISGFGGGYEACCQDMLEAGMRFLEGRASVDLRMTTFNNVYGVLIPDSDDAKALEEAVVQGSKGNATGAMHHAVMSRLGWIAAHSWDEYCAELRKRNRPICDETEGDCA